MGWPVVEASLDNSLPAHDDPYETLSRQLSLPNSGRSGPTALDQRRPFNSSPVNARS